MKISQQVWLGANVGSFFFVWVFVCTIKKINLFKWFFFGGENVRNETKL